MAERRMFSKQIIDSDPFLDMPLSTQALYFHLAMRADDDGFVNNPKKIMRMTGSNSDELQVLLSKRFVLIFESGVLVIKHWKIHNYIQKDRYKPTVYQEELSRLKLKENNGYSLDTECLQIASEMDTQVSKGKVSKGKVSKEKILPTSDEVRSLFIGYLAILNITDYDIDRTDGQIRAFIRYYIGDEDSKGVWLTSRKKFNPKSCVKNWIDKNPNIYKPYKKAEPEQKQFTNFNSVFEALYDEFKGKANVYQCEQFLRNEDQNGRCDIPLDKIYAWGCKLCNGKYRIVEKPQRKPEMQFNDGAQDIGSILNGVFK